MNKTILITGATDGIGYATIQMLLDTDNVLIIHGRTKEKVEDTLSKLNRLPHKAILKGVYADLTDFSQIKSLIDDVHSSYDKIDVLINNAGVYNTALTRTKDDLETRFVVNAIAPYYLTKSLLNIMGGESRVINLSSAAQSSVDMQALTKYTLLNPSEAYAQSKLALTMWSCKMGSEFININNKPSIIAVNPKSFLGSKMVKDAYGVAGHDIRIGADVLCRAALSTEFENASGLYFDNDQGRFANPHPDALNKNLTSLIMDKMDKLIENLT